MLQNHIFFLLSSVAAVTVIYIKNYCKDKKDSLHKTKTKKKEIALLEESLEQLRNLYSKENDKVIDVSYKEVNTEHVTNKSFSYKEDLEKTNKKFVMLPRKK